MKHSLASYFLNPKSNMSKGVSLVEVIIGVAIIVLVIAGLAGVYTTALRVSSGSPQRVKAQFLLEEGMEAVRSMRDRSWSTEIAPLTTGNTYYFEWNGTQWNSTTTDTFIDNTFSRSFVLDQVLRDGTDDIASSGTLDTDTKKVTVSVSWQERNATTTKTLVAYITNLFE